MPNLEIWIAYNEVGDFVAADDGTDAADELDDEFGGSQTAIVKLNVTVPDLEIPEVDITVEKEDASVSAEVESAE